MYYKIDQYLLSKFKQKKNNKTFIENIRKQMQYSQPYPSSVPHIILTPHQFTLDSTFYGCSMIIEIYFLSISAILFAFTIYFRIGNHKLLLDHSNNQNIKKDKENIICEVVARTNFLDKEDEESGSLSEKERNYDQVKNKNQGKNSYESEVLASQFRIYERRCVYVVSYTIPWVISVSFFDASIVLVICGAVFMGFVILFNMRRMLPDWKITILLYFLPALAGIFPYMGGNHTLYSWTPVKSPLSLQI